jgi:hypothetical protein
MLNLVGIAKIVELNRKIKKLEKLVNKPVTTTNEQPVINPLYDIVSKLIDIRNSNVNIPVEVYHKICDIEKEIIRLIV